MDAESKGRSTNYVRNGVNNLPVMYRGVMLTGTRRATEKAGIPSITLPFRRGASPTQPPRPPLPEPSICPWLL